MTAQLLDCQGRVQHTLTLQVDGRVLVQGGGTSFVVDPATGRVDPPTAPVTDPVRHAVGELAGCDAPIRLQPSGRARHHR